jgi:hypothetical protein
LVLFINENGQYEILDGQQRLLAIDKYLKGTLDLKNTEIVPYEDLSEKEKIHIDAYCIYYLRLKSHDAESKEEDIVQTFLRLQEGSPLNKAEKINAYRGAFKDAFKKARDESKLFELLNGDKRFRLRLLAAEMLLLELESDFKNRTFPSLDLQSFISALKKYAKNLSPAKLKFYKGNLDTLYRSLNYFLTALKPRDVLSFYLLISYLRSNKANNGDILNEISAFAKEFLKNLNSFSIYDKEAPEGMSESLFREYQTYKLEAKVATSPESIKNRFDIILSEFSRIKPFIEKDPTRYYDEEQKRTLFFSQNGLCTYCGKPMNFKQSTADHIIRHSEGGKTDLSIAQLVHNKCHEEIEKKRDKDKKRKK